MLKTINIARIGWVAGFCLNVLSAQVDPALDARLERRIHSFQETVLPYRLFIPDTGMSSDRLPLLLFLHGARWSGTDNISQLDNEFAVYWVQDSVQTFEPFFAVFPQCPPGRSWETVSGAVSEFPPDPEMETVKDLLDSLIREFPVDTGRLYIAGKSMGGQGVYGMLARYSRPFAAAVIAAGPAVYQDIADLSKTDLWLLHAKADEVVSSGQSRDIVNHLENLGKTVVYTHCDFHTQHCDVLSHDLIDRSIEEGVHFIYSEFDTAGHQVEPLVVRTYGLHRWVLSKTSHPTGISADLLPERFIPVTVCPNPFNSQTVVRYHLPADGRVAIRILDIRGNEAVRMPETLQTAGNHRLRIDVNNLDSGLYLVEMQAGSGRGTVKMMLIK